MRTIKMTQLISKSIDRTVLILFRPFSLKKWLFLLFIAALAGALGGGPGGGGGGWGNYHDSYKKRAVQGDTRVRYGSEFLIRNGYSEKERPVVCLANISLAQESGKELSSFGNGSKRDDIAFYGLTGFFIFLGIFVLALIIFFTWLSSRFKFIWFNAIVDNDASIIEPFTRYKREGNSLFKLFLMLLVIAIAFLGLVGAWAYFNAASMGIFTEGADPSFGQIVNAFILPLLIFIAGIILLIIFGICIEHFVVPIMAIDGSLFSQAWSKFAGIIKQNKNDFFIYFLLLIGLGIVTAIVTFMIVIALILAILIVAAILFGLPYLLFVTLLKLNLLFAIFSVIIGIPFMALMILVFMSVNLPFAVFFRSFSLYFLSSLNSGYYPLRLDTD